MKENNVPIGFYVEDPNHTIPLKRLDEKTYADAIAALVVVCTDAVIVNRERKTFYLARRTAKPMQGWWVIGGRVFAGEEPKDSIIRCFKRETSLELPKERFEPVALNRYIWKDRQQEPQNLGCDSLAYLFAVELDEAELLKVSQNLESREYNSGAGLEEFDLARLKKENVHPMIIDAYLTLF